MERTKLLRAAILAKIHREAAEECDCGYTTPLSIKHIATYRVCHSQNPRLQAIDIHSNSWSYGRGYNQGQHAEEYFNSMSVMAGLMPIRIV